MSIQSPKGTRDFYPEIQHLQNHIFDTWKKSCRLFAFEEYEGPMFEHLELFTGKSGDEIVTQLYHFQDKGGRDISLRPEMTPTLARMINARSRELSKPVKWFSMPRLFRYERSQKGRLREFFQLNMDIMGSASLLAEIDLFAAIVHMLEAFGLKTGDFRIGINSRRLLHALLEQQGISNQNPVYAALDKKAKIPEEAFRNLLAEAGLDNANQDFLSRFMAAKTLEEIAAFCSSELAQKALEELKELWSLLEATGLNQYCEIDLNIVRGLAYYTGIVFEVFDGAKSMRAVAGGGRYDNLCAKLGGEAITGVGFGMGDVVIKDLLEEKGLLPKDQRSVCDVYLASFQFDPVKTLILAKELRQHGISVSHPLQQQKFAKQMESANKQGARYVLFLDSDKAPHGHYELKDLSDGSQVIADLELLPTLIQFSK